MAKKGKIGLAQVTILLLVIAVVGYVIYTYYVPTAEASMQSVVTVYYTDGTSKVYTISSKPLSMIDPNTGKTISKIKIELYLVATFSGTAKSWTAYGDTEFQLLDNARNIVAYTSGKVRVVQQGDSITSGKPVWVTGSTVDASAIERLYSGWVSGNTYTLRYIAHKPWTLQLTFTDDSTASKGTEQAYALDWQFKYQATNQIESVSLSWQILPQD